MPDRQGWIASTWVVSGQGLDSVAKREALTRTWTDFIAAVIAGARISWRYRGNSVVLCFSLENAHCQKPKDAFSTYLAMTLTLMITGEAFFKWRGRDWYHQRTRASVHLLRSKRNDGKLDSHWTAVSISSETRDVPIEQGWKAKSLVTNCTSSESTLSLSKQ